MTVSSRSKQSLPSRLLGQVSARHPDLRALRVQQSYLFGETRIISRQFDAILRFDSIEAIAPSDAQSFQDLFGRITPTELPLS